MSEDIRVLLVKLADRLHNMRTLHFIKDADEAPPHRARDAWRSTRRLAERIGMHDMKDELEDLAFAELNPDARDGIMARLAFLREKGGDLVERIIEELQRDARREAGIDRRGVGPREDALFDLAQDAAQERRLRAAVRHHGVPRRRRHDRATAIRRWASIHSRYPVVPGRFKDYISTPKPNNYRCCTPA